MILIIDNYDSFTYNLYQLVGELEKDILVKRNDEITIEEIKQIQPDKIIISPGPGNPLEKRDFGICMDVINEFKGKIPILGVCLGHQGIFAAFGGKITRSNPIHGKLSQIKHSDNGIFKGVETSLIATRYHSLVCDEKSIPECIEITAKTDDGIIMGIKHVKSPIFGLQFHPESIGTVEGVKIIKNFLEIKT
ncbi:MAG: aminodeoxychorismate/anthranilate synthase component II [Methanobacterium sp.]|uniref:anthranilate synthase component II n=1 Tax=Methanobacterium sp. TaxID=2164 RepID=UPI003D655B71|nr:aminodeoxychorismate/anthranilate synthase component II [Methanobacterium sp.]